MKNYTSTVDAETSIFRIERLLVRFGARGISKECAGGEVTGVSFSIHVVDAEGDLNVKLPANIEAVATVLAVGKKRGRNQTQEQFKKKILEQARRTAWKLVQEWIEIQLSLVQMRQAEAAQVFLPYIWNGRETLYQGIKDKKFLGIAHKPE